MESKDRNELKTNFSVSNTDVITMLVVKNREKLNEQREEHRLVYADGVEKLFNEINQKWIKYITKKTEGDKTIEAYYSLLKLLNPKAKFKLDFGIKSVSDSIRHTVYSVCGGHGYCGENKNGDCEFNIKSIDVCPEFSQDEDGDKEQSNFHYVTSGTQGTDSYSSNYCGLNLDVNFKAKYNVPDAVKEASKKIDEIDKLLKNENALKEKLIAKVTENALKQMPELQSLVMGTDLIALDK